MNNFEQYSFSYLLVSARSALISEVLPCFRGMAVDWREKTVVTYYYLDGEVSDELRNDCWCIGTEIIADFSEAKIDENVIRLDYPQPLPKHSHWAFLRYENDTIEQPVDVKDYAGIHLSLLYALLGKILPSLRGVAALTQEKGKADLLFYLDGPFDEKVKQYYENVANQVRKLNPQHEISFHIERRDFPHQLPEHLFCWVFKRNEPRYSGVSD